ncbi:MULTISPECIES: SGNH/GDSL hydrolase family protein [unclassified Psychrobacter]|uniref:SGNH/GDSL hydrolase family protein n=1 Tax=unclassified Psychrobacter TaxID=196806 RepID=UPI0025B2E0F5|nr:MULTISPECIES: SGNH/GDSL hydrolase family protein [unclassified Psychrobacter]MDN3451984.1 SGNH/GDSL hydrolase family protein [Psychrobacter sp. APC 3350]MDN3501738.1 SGNH/GDSL hydrolase family protein [Psychrobacter sp. 5A.1]
MVNSNKMATVARDVLLAPVYLYQGRRIKRDTVRLPEPHGERHGHVQLNHSANTLSANTQKDAVKKTLTVMIVGDSAAAGVGSQTQQEALAGKLIPILQQQSVIQTQFDELTWSLQATTGHTSFDILRRLYILPAPSQAVDIMVLSVGVNDTTANVSARKWQQQIEAIIAIAQRKFGVRELIFSSLPPMAQMPAIPAPLNNFVGAKASILDKILQKICAEHDSVTYMATDFPRMIEEHASGTPIDITVMFASDGFHPSSLMYGYWAQQLSELITQLLDPSTT